VREVGEHVVVDVVADAATPDEPGLRAVEIESSFAARLCREAATCRAGAGKALKRQLAGTPHGETGPTCVKKKEIDRLVGPSASRQV